MAPNAAQELSAAFQRRLPYAAEFTGLTKQHMTDLVQDMPSLHIKTREYTHIDGRTAELLLAEGTVPMYYQGIKYNIPVAVWLPERYPLAAPLVYVVPTPDMVIKPRHSFVDASGLVHTLYIAQWQYPTSNLREMAQDMSMLFGGDPPLFSKPKNWIPPPPLQQQQQQQPPRPAAAPSGYAVYGGGSGSEGGSDVFHAHNPLAQASAGSFGSAASGGSFSGAPSAGAPRPPAAGASGAAGPAGAASGGFDSVWAAVLAASGSGSAQQGPPPQQQAAQPPPPPPVQQPPRVNPSAKLSAAFRSSAVASLNKCLHASLTAVAQQAAAGEEEQRGLQATLRQRGEQLQSEVAALQAERVALDKLSQDLAASSAQLDRWLSENEHLAKAADDPSSLDPDTVIKAADPLSQQALEVQAQDLAIEDALYALDKSLNAAQVEPDAYLKQVRALCRRQFFTRVVGLKIAAAQSSAPGTRDRDVQRTFSAGRPVVLPQGDSWANAGILASHP